MTVTKVAKLIYNFAYRGLAITAHFKSRLPVYQSSLQSIQIVPAPEGWSWCEMDGKWKPVWMTLKRPKPVLSSLNVAANKDVLKDVNVEMLISLVQVAFQFSK